MQLLINDVNVVTKNDTSDDDDGNETVIMTTIVVLWKGDCDKCINIIVWYWLHSVKSISDNDIENRLVYCFEHQV